MRFTFLLLLFLCLNANAQDTIVLSPSLAVSMALENNGEARNSLLRISGAAEAAKKAMFEIEPAEILYRSGNLYSDMNSRYLSISQNLGSLPEHILNRKITRAELIKTTAGQEINKKRITSDVKSAYYSWIYHNNLVKLLSDRQKALSQLSERVEAGIDYQNSEFKDYYYLEPIVAEAGIELVNGIADLEIAANNLRMLIMGNYELVPSVSSLPLYQVERMSDTATYNGSSIVSYYRENLNVSSLNTQLMKSAFFPDIKAGIINQQIEPFGDLWGWQVGIQIPLIFTKQSHAVKQAAIEEEMAFNNLESITFRTEKEIENLLIELDKYFRSIIYYDRYSLPRIENNEKTASEGFLNNQISFAEYLDVITASYQVRTEYLRIVNDYNQTAIKLEFYIN